MALFSKCPLCGSRLGDDGARMTQAGWLLAEAHKALERADEHHRDLEQMAALTRKNLAEIEAMRGQYEDVLARARGVLGATTNEDYFLRLNVLIHQHDEYYALLVGKAVAETMHRAYTITMNPN